MSDDRKTDEEKFAKILRDFGQRGARDRRERIATAMLAGGFFAGIREAIDAADELIRELDKEDGR